jgi:hypothetical protein
MTIAASVAIVWRLIKWMEQEQGHAVGVGDRRKIFNFEIRLPSLPASGITSLRKKGKKSGESGN